MSLGKRESVFVRIYDKLDELENNSEQREAKLFVLNERRWGGVEGPKTRVEFQVAGSWMRSKWEGCREGEDVFDKLDSLMAYLTEEYFRLTDCEVDRDNKNQSRAETSSLWKEVMSSAADWIEKRAQELRRLEKKPADGEHAARRLFTAAMGVAALAPGVVVDKQSFIQRVLDVLLKVCPPEWEVMSELQRRRDKLLRSGEAGVFTFDKGTGLSSGWKVSLVPLAGDTEFQV